MQVVSLRGDSWKPEQGGERVREGSQGGVCFPAAASGGCYSVLSGDSAGVRRLGQCDPPAPCRARSAASMALRPWPEVFAVTFSSGCCGGECRDVRKGCVHICSVLFFLTFIYFPVLSLSCDT